MIRFLALATVFASAAAPRDLYLLIGQSNMAGRGVVTDANRLSSKGVLKFTEKGQWAEGVEPIHYDRPTVGAGPGLAFARAMVDGTDVEIGLVPCAEGGSPLKRWEPGKDLYTNAVARMKAALATGGRLRGILWHQGEADSWTKENASTYGVRLTNMVTRLRAELGAKYVPFLAGEVGLHYATSIAKRGGKPFVSLVNRQIKEAISHLPAAGWVSAEGLEPGPDGIHFTTESAYELGRRYAREMTRWQSVPDQTLEGVDYGGAAANWKPSATAYGFNLQGMRMAGPHVGFKSDYFKWLADWGFNFVRLPLASRCWVKDRKSANREFIDERGLEPLDAGIAAARRNGVTVMICLHRIPGEYCVQVRDPEPGNIYADPDCLSAAVKHWSLLAARYRDVPRENLYFNLINEPSAQMGTHDQYEYVCRVLAAAIRKVDPKRFIVADGWPSGSFPVPGLYDVPGIGQATRGYYPMGFTHFGMTPGLSPQHDTATVYPPVWPLRRDRPDGRLGGPRWKDWRDPFIVEDAPAGDYELALAMVSGPVTVAVETNGVPCSAFPLEPKLNDADWQALSRYRGVGALRGEYRKTLRFTLPTSVRTLAIRVREGDWAMPRVLVARSEGRELRLDFGGNMKAMKNVRWNRRFVGWDAASPLPAGDGPVAPAFYADEGMDAIAGGNLEPWRETVKKGIWCMVGEFGCANHVAHADALRFLDSNLKLFRELGLGWAAWGFSGSRFGILNSCRADVDYEDWHGEKLDRKMLELLQRQVKVPATGDDVQYSVSRMQPSVARQKVPATIDDEATYLKWKWRTDLSDPKTGLSNAALKAGVKTLCEAYEDKEPWAETSARMFAYLADNMAIGFSKFDCFPAIASWNRWDRPLSPVLGRRSAKVDAKYSPDLPAKIKALHRSGRGRADWKDFDHSAPDWEKILKLGFPGMKARVDAYTADTPFYRSEKSAAETILRFLDRLIRTAKAHPDAASPLMQKEIASLERLRAGPPQTCFDVMQFTMLYFILSEHVNRFQVRTLGNIDASWWPYYRDDLAAGRTTEAEFREEFRHFIWQFGSIDNYWGHPMYLGGTKADGATAYNPLSEIILDVIDREALPTPKFQVKLAANTPEAIWTKALDMLRRHRSLVLMNEKGMADSMKPMGVSDDERRDLLVWGCYEYLPRGKGNCTSGFRLNMLQPVLDILADAAAGKPAPPTFAEFLAR